jgi:RNA polymerase sigma factor (sigma-70 family)
MAPLINFSEDPNSALSSDFSALFTHHFNILYNYGMRIIYNEEIVKDCIQELFFRIWKNNIDISAISNPKAYLIRGLRHQIINVLELKQNSIKKVDLEECLNIEYSPEDYFIIDQQEEVIRERVLNGLSKLSKKQREVLYLRFFEELEYKEIAEIMKINIQSVKNTLQRAYNPLRHYLNKFSAIFFSLI